VCHETLRLYPGVPMLSRKLAQPMTLAGVEVPAGVGVGASMLLAHYNEAVFPEPERFRPERFVGKSYAPVEFMPFGGGVRRCLGAAFALYELKLVMATLVRGWRFALADERPLRMAARVASVGPRGGVPMVVVERRQAGGAA
jgi:cytochrome P450